MSSTASLMVRIGTHAIKTPAISSRKGMHVGTKVGYTVAPAIENELLDFQD